MGAMDGERRQGLKAFADRVMSGCRILPFMSASASPAVVSLDSVPTAAVSRSRVTSVDALRGLVVLTMIFVNDLAGAPNTVVPAWMKHFQAQSGMTFVDLVFPAFLFIVGMSLPLALGSRMRRGEPLWRLLGHVFLRTASLLCIGVLMVNGIPDAGRMGWSGALWATLMYLSAILAFCTISPGGGGEDSARHRRLWRPASISLRVVGLASL
jgi:heparan-alpha-glucosaminide N-acetyltransferase